MTEKYKNYSLATAKPLKSQTLYHEKVWTLQEQIYNKLKRLAKSLEPLYPTLTDDFSSNVKGVLEKNINTLLADLDLMKNNFQKNPEAFHTNKLKLNQSHISEMKGVCDTLQTVRSYEHEHKNLDKIKYALHELEHLIHPTNFEKSLEKLRTESEKPKKAAVLKGAAKKGKASAPKPAAKKAKPKPKKAATAVRKPVAKKATPKPKKSATAVRKPVAKKTATAVRKPAAKKTAPKPKKAVAAVRKPAPKKAAPAARKPAAKKAAPAARKPAAKKATPAARKPAAKKVTAAVHKPVAKAATALHKPVAKKGKPKPKATAKK